VCLAAGNLCGAAAVIIAAGGVRASNGTFDYGIGTTDTGTNFDGFGRAVLFASTALHAGIPVHNDCFLPLYFKYGMGAYYLAHAAAGAFMSRQFQGDDIFKITVISHVFSP